MSNDREAEVKHANDASQGLADGNFRGAGAPISAQQPTGVGSIPLTPSNQVTRHFDPNKASPVQFPVPAVKKTYSEERLSPIVTSLHKPPEADAGSQMLDGFAKTKSFVYMGMRPEEPQPYSKQNVQFLINPNAPVYSLQRNDYSLLRGTVEDTLFGEDQLKRPNAERRTSKEEEVLQITPLNSRPVAGVPQLQKPQTIEVTSPRKANSASRPATQGIFPTPLWKKRVCYCPIWLWAIFALVAAICLMVGILHKINRQGACSGGLHFFKGQCIMCPDVSSWNGTHCIVDQLALQRNSFTIKHSLERPVAFHKQQIAGHAH